MNEYINKSDVLNEITAEINNFITELRNNAAYYASFIDNNVDMAAFGAKTALDIAKETINKAEETEEIIHCKDCKHYCNILYQGTQFEYGECSESAFSRIFSNGTGPDDFCSKAEEKE